MDGSHLPTKPTTPAEDADIRVVAAALTKERNHISAFTGVNHISCFNGVNRISGFNGVNHVSGFNRVNHVSSFNGVNHISME